MMQKLRETWFRFLYHGLSFEGKAAASSAPTDLKVLAVMLEQ